MTVEYAQFIWDFKKEQSNIIKHGIDFIYASEAFKDSNRLVFTDEKHSVIEDRFFCLGKVDNQIITVRFTLRGNQVRIIGAGFWRRGKKLYEEKNNLL